MLRYTLFCPALRTSWGLRPDVPLATRHKLTELKASLEEAINSGYDWWIIDNKKPNDWVERDIVYRVCQIEMVAS